MDNVINPASTNLDVVQSFDVQVLDASQLDDIRATVKTWLGSYGIAAFDRLPEGMLLTRAALIPLAKVSLRTRFETRNVSSRKEAFKTGMSYEKRNVSLGNFPIWSYVLGEGIGNLCAGVLPSSVTQKIRYSDDISDCRACSARGRLSCGQCSGQGDFRCGACHGDIEVKCGSCGGTGEKKCLTCNGHGEKACYACRSGIRHNGERCTACHGRGYTRCNACSDGFKGCDTCARRGIVQCPSCRATGRVDCSACRGAGEVACAPCSGSGKFITSLYVAASQSETLEDAWVTPPEYDSLVPADVTAWLQRNVGIAAARELSALQFDAAPCGRPDSPLAQAAFRLIAESRRNVHFRTDADRVDASGGCFVRIVRHWYAEHYLPLVRVDYRSGGRDHSLWTVAPGMTLADHERGFATKGSSVFASEGPVAEHLERLLDAAESALNHGQLAQTGRLADTLLKAVPGLRKAALLKASAIHAQRLFAATGSLLGAAGASAFCLARLHSGASLALSKSATAALIAGILAASAPWLLTRVIYKTRVVAVLAQCALLCAILLPVVATLPTAAPQSPAQSVPALVPVPVRAPVEAHAVSAGFDCGKSITAVEKMICADPQLFALDGRLASLYRRSLVVAADQDTLRRAQRNWLKKVRNRCGDPECLAQAYEARIAEFASWR